jgi:hypothetical protein
VVLGHLLHVPPGFTLPAFDDQHAELHWWPLTQALSSPAVHLYSRSYLESRVLQEPATGQDPPFGSSLLKSFAGF